MSDPTEPVSEASAARRPQTRAEEFANSLSHGFGFLLAVAGAPVLIVAALRRGTVTDVVAVSVFAAAMALLYLTSALYHGLPHGPAKRFFHRLDHMAIYLLIAGTYTPFTLGVLQGAWGWTLFGLVWGLAVFGIVLKSIGGLRRHGLSIALYVTMGWIIVVAVKPLWDALPVAGLLWLVAGGVAYTAGVGFYVANNLRYSHLIWHLFVLTGTACHFFAVLHYSI